MRSRWRSRLGAAVQGGVEATRRPVDLDTVGRGRPDPDQHVELPRHQESWLELAQLGSRNPPYLPTYPCDGFLNDTHRSLSRYPLRDGVVIEAGIPGWLRPEDALKLYELAYFSPGDILEIGTHEGLSAFVIASAMRDSGRPTKLLTVDISAKLARRAAAHLGARGLDTNVRFAVGDATRVCKQIVAEGRRFSLVFVDHAHEYEPVLEVCRALAALILPHGFCLFHDFNDARNADPDAAGYGVPQAVAAGLSPSEFEFHGIFGCSALYRARPDARS